MWELEFHGGREQVNEAIRQRTAPPAPPTPTWDGLKAAYEAATAHMRAHEAIPSPAFGDDALDAHERETEQLADARADAFAKLTLFPAPDTAALAFKLKAYRDVIGGDSWTRSAELIAQLAADAARLTGEA